MPYKCKDPDCGEVIPDDKVLRVNVGFEDEPEIEIRCPHCRGTIETIEKKPIKHDPESQKKRLMADLLGQLNMAVRGEQAKSLAQAFSDPEGIKELEKKAAEQQQEEEKDGGEAGDAS